MGAGTNTGQVNINSDLGESFGPWVMGNDSEVLKIVRSANVACGMHAGDPHIMARTFERAKALGVAVGALTADVIEAFLSSFPAATCRRGRN